MCNAKTLFSSVSIVLLLSVTLSANALTISGGVEADLPWGESFVSVRDTSTLNINNHTGASFIDAYDQSTVNADDAGHISWLNMHNGSSANISAGNISWLSMYDGSSANISGGDYSWIQLFDNSTANIFSGFTTSWFLVGSGAQVNIFGEQLNYANGRVTGLAANGDYYSFGLSAIDSNGSILSGNIPTNVTLNSLPLPQPDTLLLFFIGLAFLVGFEMKNRFSFGQFRTAVSPNVA